MPNSRTRSRRWKRNKSSPLVENSPNKSKPQKRVIVNDSNIRESDRESITDLEPDTDTLSQVQPQSLLNLLETPELSEQLNPENINLPVTPPSPKMQDGQDYVQPSQQPQDLSQGSGFDTHPPIINPVMGMMSYQQSPMSGHAFQGHSAGPQPAVTELDLIKIATIVKSMLQQEISDQVQQKVDDVTKSLKTELTRVNNELVKTQSDLSELRSDHESLKNEVTALKSKQDDTEQYSRRMCLRISGIRETRHEDVMQKVLDFANSINTHITPADIDRAHRVGPPRTNNTNINEDDVEHGVFADGTSSEHSGEHSAQSESKGREIIIKFTNSSARLNLLKGRSVLRERNMKNIFINEDLTPTWKLLAFECRRIKRIKNSNIRKTWIYAGFPHILDTAGNKLRITCLSDLEVYEVKQVPQPMNTNHAG